MSKLKHHIEGGRWLQWYDEAYRGHVLSFWYNLFLWLERDQADQLILSPDDFTWKRQDVIVGRFPITVPEPDRSFYDFLLEILKRDAVIRQLVIPTDDPFRFWIQLAAFQS